MLNANIAYKGFLAKVHFNEAQAAYIAQVVNSQDTIICKGKSPQEIAAAMQQCIDIYLHACKNKGITPQRYC